MLAKYLLWRSIQRRKSSDFLKQEYFYIHPKQGDYHDNDEKICRICTSPANIPVTEKICGIDILSGIRAIAHIWIMGTDTYPKYICLKCLEDLKTALTFKKKCESAHYAFQQALPPGTLLANTAPPMVFHDFASIIRQMKENRTNLEYAEFDHSAADAVIDYSLDDQNSDGDMENDMNECTQEALGIEVPKKKVKKKKKSVKIKPIDVVHHCRRCNITFDTKQELVEHRRQKSCLNPACPICGKLVANLSKHKKIVHLRAEKNTCHICGKVMYTTGGLRNHLLSHSDEFGFPCPLCPYKGKQQAYLTLHMRVHTGERPYLCSQCPAKFVNPSNLRKHSLIHSSKKFECTKCHKQFRQQKTLQEHYEAAHLNVRYRCSICGRDLWTRRKLLSHELRVHKREKHKLYEEVFKVVVNDEND